MERIYTICLIIGIMIPLLSLFGNFMHGVIDFISFDFFHIDIGGWEIDFLPLSINSLCLWTLLFGGIGNILDGRYSTIKVNCISFASGYAAAFLLQILINKLKKVKNLSIDKSDILTKQAVVSNSILENRIGAVCIQLDNGSNVTYPAKSATGEPILQGLVVIIIGEDGECLVVSKAKTDEVANENKEEK